jgi:chlorobactene glucosyltransferase
VIRATGVIILILALALKSFWLMVLSLPVLYLIWITNVAMKHVLRRNCRELPELRADDSLGEEGELPGVTVIAPGRNEQDGIEACARSLAALDYPRVEAIVVNDHSTDATKQILDRLHTELPDLRIIHDPEMQEGWLGKANAIWRAVEAANPENEWLLLTDADVVLHPKVLRRAVAVAEREGFDYLTCVPVLECKTFAEQLILPPNWKSLLVSARPPGRKRAARSAMGIGAFALVRRKTYLSTGGHSAFHAQQPEDTLLALLIRHCGGKIGVAWTSELARVRIYRGYRQAIEASVRKIRVNADDRIRHLFGRTTYWITQTILPLPLGVWSLWQQIDQYPVHGLQKVLALYTLLAFSAYYAAASEIQATRVVCPVPAYIPWLNPITGLLKVWIDIKAAWQIITGKPMNWRGRDFVNVRTRS